MQPGPWLHRRDEAAAGEELPGELKRHGGIGQRSPSLFTHPHPGQRQPPPQGAAPQVGGDDRQGKRERGGGGDFFFASFLLEAVFIPLVKCQMKSFRPKLVLSSSLRLFTL